MPDGLPPSLRFLKALVTVLTLTLIGGVITITALIVTRMPSMGAAPALPGGVTLPQGASARAVTFGSGWHAVVTTDDRILIFDAATGALRQEVAILPAK